MFLSNSQPFGMDMAPGLMYLLVPTLVLVAKEEEEEWTGSHSQLEEAIDGMSCKWKIVLRFGTSYGLTDRVTYDEHK